MATYNKFNDFNNQLSRGTHQLHAAGHTVKAMLTNTAPVATNSVKTDLTEIAAGNGYTAGGFDVQNDISTNGATASLTGVDIAVTASGGAIAQFRYVSLYNDTAASDNLICWYDHGSSVDLSAGQTFNINFGATIVDIS